MTRNQHVQYKNILSKDIPIANFIAVMLLTNLHVLTILEKQTNK